ncbi:MAG: response regulator, partial [Myxococcota bacterium]
GWREALKRVADGSRIDVVLLDVLMPDLGGEEVLRSLRRDRPEIPVILATGFGDETTLRHFSEHGVVGLLRKPYEAETLIDRVRCALEGVERLAAPSAS